MLYYLLYDATGRAHQVNVVTDQQEMDSHQPGAHYGMGLRKLALTGEEAETITFEGLNHWQVDLATLRAVRRT